MLDLLPRLGLGAVEAIELTDGGDEVVLGVRNPQLQEVAGVQFHGQVFNEPMLMDPVGALGQVHAQAVAAGRGSAAFRGFGISMTAGSRDDNPVGGV